ncbi:MAG TPA: hypothetical protein PLD39_00580 [Flexilinea sp.]|nr:hypothetical protein [Flexilinea sp.]
MSDQNCVSIKIRKGIWEAFNEIALRKQLKTIELIDNVLIDYAVDHVNDCQRFTDLVDSDNLLISAPKCIYEQEGP